MKRFLAFVFIFAFLLTGCKINSPDITAIPEKKESKKEASQEEIQEGGTLRVNIASFDTLNPFLNDNEMVRQLLNLTLEPLVTLDKSLKPVPLLAYKWEVNGLNIKFYLRKNIKWQDGESFTARDVKFTMDSFLDKGSKSPYKDLIKVHISSYREIGDYEFEVSLNGPVANPLALFIFPIVAEHQYKDKGDIVNPLLVPIGTGPYKIVSYGQGNSVVLKRNPHYWGEKPHLEEINFKIVSDENAMITSFLSKEADFTFIKDVDWDKYRENSSINIYKYTLQRYVFLAPNLKKQVFSDVAVRKAIAYGIDVDRILREVYFKHGLKSNVPIRPDSWLYSPKIASLYSIKEADKVLQDAGWLKANGIRTKGGYQLKFNLLVNSDNPYLLKVAQIIKTNLKEIGIDINVVPASWDDLLKSVFSGNFDLALMEWNLNYNQDISSLFMTRGKDNFMGYSNPSLDDLFNKVFSETDEKSLRNNYYKVGEILAEEQPVIGLFYLEGAVMAYDNVKGIDPTSFNVFNNISSWYLKKQY